MSEPTVCAVMLVDGRPEMTRRAIASFRAQTYERKRLLVLDSGDPWLRDLGARTNEAQWIGMEYIPFPVYQETTIGALRNKANQIAAANGPCDLIAHFDSDDVSSPRRLEEQVALLEASGKACVGYREVLFWDTRIETSLVNYQKASPRNEAWIYRNPDPRWVCGASMMMTRQAWEACPFDDAPGEDQLWWLKNAEKCASVSSVDPTLVDIFMSADVIEDGGDPRMICGIHGVQGHGGNTEAYSRKDMLSGGGGVWFRAPEWDAYAERTMRL